LIDRGYEGFAVDIWSAGVVLFAMLYGTVPFKANNYSDLQKQIIKGEFVLQDGISSEAKDLLKAILEKNPSKRITIPQILAHPWMLDAKESVDLFTSAEKSFMMSQILNLKTEN
jgi:serine/threonine protein kinase